MSYSIKEIIFKFLVLVIMSFIARHFKLISTAQGIGMAVGMTLIDTISYFIKKYKKKNK